MDLSTNENCGRLFVARARESELRKILKCDLAYSHVDSVKNEYNIENDETAETDRTNKH